MKDAAPAHTTRGAMLKQPDNQKAATGFGAKTMRKC